ncbi:hypothetical protein BDZ94DRAFT_1267131 [Collybia nuda]|uniref:Transmembrane protein n=1 Tax=Collybia nuda TaxID=64659 RepID=A0A9P6CBV8_9AGAR|nr:hypothetical protein BDZ94DRAFT_1267131 [Collybia nuda]
MKMTSGALAPLVALFTLIPVVASADVPVCLNTQSQWSYNSLGQSPCEMASYLEGVCSTTGTNVDIPPLETGEYYIAGSPQFTTACRCSTVVYSLLSACALCQSSGTFKGWSTYSFNCTSSMTYLSNFPANIPSGTRVPHWAYLDVVTLDVFSASLAQDSLNAPESTPVQQATTTSARGFTTGIPGHTAPAQDSGSKKSNAGAIAGGVIGGLAFLAIVGGLMFWLVRRRRRTLGKPITAPAPMSPPTSQYVDYNPVSLYPAPSPSLQKPYDPSDPNTFPTPSPVPYSPVTLPYQTGTPPPGSVTTTSVATAPAPIQVPMQGPNRYSTAGQGHGYSGVPEL